MHNWFAKKAKSQSSELSSDNSAANCHSTTASQLSAVEENCGNTSQSMSQEQAGPLIVCRTGRWMLSD